uniref:Uncharacterized protein n=1 Tax=viral metagenome TaxID=1070528 RepID=A0A6C0C015_9ZZZZ
MGQAPAAVQPTGIAAKNKIGNHNRELGHASAAPIKNIQKIA